MTPTPNHRVRSREHLAEATLLADAGRTADAHAHLLSAADHALLALPDPVAIVVPCPCDAEPDFDDCFERVQALIDACLAEPAPPPRANVPMCGGASGAMRWRGAATAGRALQRMAHAVRR